jgi:WD40 repeat protein
MLLQDHPAENSHAQSSGQIVRDLTTLRFDHDRDSTNLSPLTAYLYMRRTISSFMEPAFLACKGESHFTAAIESQQKSSDGYNSGTAFIWDHSNPQCIITLPEHKNHSSVSYLAWHPNQDSNRITWATVDNYQETICVWTTDLSPPKEGPLPLGSPARSMSPTHPETPPCDPLDSGFSPIVGQDIPNHAAGTNTSAVANENLNLAPFANEGPNFDHPTFTEATAGNPITALSDGQNTEFDDAETDHMEEQPNIAMSQS